jgi:hypothetical protein
MANILVKVIQDLDKELKAGLNQSLKSVTNGW